MKANPYVLALGAVQKRKSNTTQSSGIPTWAKLVLVGVAGFAVYKLIQHLNKGKFSRQEDKSALQELDKLNSNPSTKQTITKLQAQMLAGQLFSAMDGYGTNEDAIINVFLQLKNNADFVAVSSAYGVRETSSGKLNPEPNFKGNLTQTLTNELGNSDANWKNKINQILKLKKINYQI